MLPPGYRIRRREEFTAVVRRGRRAGRRCLVAHLLRRPADPSAEALPEEASAESPAGPPRAGFIVARTVGGAVVRNRVRRRLRHLVLERLHTLPEGSLLVVRANPPAAQATYDELAAELDSALAKLLRQRESGARDHDARRQAGVRRPR
ncbi:MAG: ribonuclease P protein component [Streptosporangiales bacterium]|nr:ribonuclease P protein component [Streptosporangiales bacterium]